MSYSACDFVDDIASGLGVELSDTDDDGDLQALAGYALTEIARLQRLEAAYQQGVRYSADPD